MIVIGSVFVDVKGIPEGTYLPGGRNAGRVEQVHGGVARNMAADLAAAGQKPVFVGLADDTGTGEDVVRRLTDAGADTRYMRRVPGGMGTWLAVFDGDGEVAASVSARPDLHPIGDILDEQGDEIFAGADGALFELDLEEETVARICALGEKHGVPLYAAVSNIRIAALRRAFLPRLGCFVCNLQELGILCPGDWESLPPEELAARLPLALEKTGLRALVVTLGAEGSAWARAEGAGLCPAEKADVVDTAGAGDAFAAGLALGLSRGKSLEGACRVGSVLAAGAIGSRESVCPGISPEKLGI